MTLEEGGGTLPNPATVTARSPLPETFPFLNTPEFQFGQQQFQNLVKHGRSIDPMSGRWLVEGLSLQDGKSRILVPAKTPEEYVTQVRVFLATAQQSLQRNIRLPIRPDLIIQLATNPKAISTFKINQGEQQLAAEDLLKIKMQMTGFGKAALDRGDIRTALLVLYEVTGGRANPQIRAAVNAEIFKLDPQSKSVADQTMAEIAQRARVQQDTFPIETPPSRRERPKIDWEKVTPYTKIAQDPLSYYAEQGLKVKKLGDSVDDRGSDIYAVKGPQGFSVVKIPITAEGRKWLFNEINALDKARGRAGLPVIRRVFSPSGIVKGFEMERVLGRPLSDKQVVASLTPDAFTLDQRLWFIYDLLEAYKTTDSAHGDLLSGFVDSKTGEQKLFGHFDHMILEYGTPRLRMIDFGAGGEVGRFYLESDNMKVNYAQRELVPIIEFLFMDRSVERVERTHEYLRGLPSNPAIQKVGAEILANIERVNAMKDLPQIIPASVRLPNEDSLFE